jgi:dephospho-CoA kinase
MDHFICFGLTGQMGSGKGEVVKILKSYGFRYISLSDMVREEIARLGQSVTRKETQDIGNRMRQQEGAGVLGKRVRIKIESSQEKRWVIDGIRNPAEVTELRVIRYFYLIGINVEMHLLLQRIKKRQRSTDTVSEEELKRVLEREWGIGEPENGQRVGDCLAMAEYVVDNNHSIENLREKVSDILINLNII